MSPLEFFFYVILVSTSGVFSPGPLFFVNLFYGSKYGSIMGLKIAVGHTLVEFPLLVLLFYGISKFSSMSISDSDILKIIGIVGGVFMIFFSFIQVYPVIKNKSLETNNQNSRYTIKNAILVGMIFTGLNPFFLVWWSTIGLKLVSDSVNNFGYLSGIILLFFSHIWMDYFWLWITSFMSSKGRSIIKQKFYRILLLSFSTIIGIFGVNLLVSAFL
ncbi:MAG TPA: LysE family transporter [Nitrososphaeraceae archaeon]|nr:LysE family transporter [Nitrososphaeraceae archaeon]